MELSDQLALLSLASTKGIGPVTVRSLISHLGSPQAVFSAPLGKLKRAPGVGEKVAGLIHNKTAQERAEKEIAWCEKSGVKLISYLDPAYPNLLKYIHHAPLFLFKKGSADLNAQPNIAIVGTRNATEYGKELTDYFAGFFARLGINVVSGLAYGIDITAHKAVLKNDGITTCVLAHGLDIIYPSVHKTRAIEMLEKGAWLSEYMIGTKPDAPHFPSRNRIVAGMSQAVIVIEAGETGGALITAKQAFDSNRQVYAIPGRVGDPFSAGCHQLISENFAQLVTSPEEVLEDLEIKWFTEKETLPKAPSIPLNKEESLVLNVLQEKEMLMDQLADKTGLAIQKLNSLLLSMEFKGLLKQMPGKKFKMR